MLKNQMLFIQKMFFPFVIIIFVLKFVHLEGDPPVLKQPFDLDDEAFWAGNARLKILTDHWTIGNYSGGIAVAPLSSLLTYISFKTFGINQIGIRVVPLAASFFILFFIFQLLKKHDLQLAKLSVFLLSCNYTFWTYSRIGHLEIIMIVFLIMSFNFFIRENYISYFFASLSLFLAFLVKFSALLFYPVVLIYLCFKLINRATQLNKLIVFLTSLLFFFLCFYFFYYQQYLPVYQDYLVHLQGKTSFNQQLNLIGIAQKIIFLPLNDFFTEPAVCILSIFTMVGLIKNIDFRIFTQKSTFIKNEPLIISVIWLFAFIPGLLLTDFTPRRINLLLVPLSILAANYIKGFDSNDDNFYFKKYILIISFFFLLPLLGLHLNFHLIKFLPSKWFEGLTITQANDKITTGLLIIFTITFLFIFISGIAKKHGLRVIKLSVCVFLAILILNTLMVVNNRFEFGFNRIILLVIAILFILITYFLLFRNNFGYRLILFWSYLIICMTLIAHDLIYATFTRQQTTKEIHRIIGNKKAFAIFFHNGWDVALETNLLPLYYFVEIEQYVPVKKIQRSFLPKFFITSLKNNESSDFIRELNFVKSHFNAKPVLVKEFSLFPVKNMAKEKLLLYKLVYDERIF